MRSLLGLALSLTIATALAGDPVSVFQWRGAGDLEAALTACTQDTHTPAGVVVLHTGPHALLVKVLEGEASSQLDARCMRSHGLELDRSIQHASQNPQYVALYEKLTGLRIQSPSELAQEEAARAAKAQAQRQAEDAQLERCASSEATVGDAQRCEQLEALR